MRNLNPDLSYTKAYSLTLPFNKEQMTKIEIASFKSLPKSVLRKMLVLKFNETTNGETPEIVLRLERTLSPSCPLRMYALFCVYAILHTKKTSLPHPLERKILSESM